MHACSIFDTTTYGSRFRRYKRSAQVQLAAAAAGPPGEQEVYEREGFQEERGSYHYAVVGNGACTLPLADSGSWAPAVGNCSEPAKCSTYPRYLATF